VVQSPLTALGQEMRRLFAAESIWGSLINSDNTSSVFHNGTPSVITTEKTKLACDLNEWQIVSE